MNNLMLSEQIKSLDIDTKFLSDSRAEKRREFDAIVSQKIAEREIVKEAERIKKTEDEERQLQEMRRKPVSEGGLNFVAAPILSVDPFPVRVPDLLPTTNPKSPFLITKLRASMHIDNNTC